ncbi:MAG TPA: MFS transporter, partial [Clostridiaceae bacterium]|nr:MFS transporter [Clostridiaceae bacterium]
RAIHRQPILYILIGTMATFLGTTYGIGNWFINYMAEAYHFDSDERGLYMTIFVLLRVVGLFTGGFIADRLGLYRSMIIYSGVAFSSIFVGTILGRHGLWLISASGLAFAVVYPGVVTTVKKVFPVGSAYAMGFVLTGATLIAMLISGLIGFLNSLFDVYRSFFMLPFCMFITFLLCIVIKRQMATKAE